MWVSLPPEVRHRLSALFSIPHSSNTHVDDGKVLTDGVTTEDIKHLTMQKMQAYLHDDSTDFHKLFDKVLERVHDDMNGKKDEILVSSDSPVTITIDAKPKRKYEKKSK